MNLIKLTAVMLTAVVLAACGGGGGDPGRSAFGSGTTPSTGVTSTASSVDVLTSLTQLGTGSTDEATITVIVKGAGSVALASAPVTLVASSGSLVVASTTTDASGVVTAKLKAGDATADKANRTITVTATSGTAVGTINVSTVGTAASFSGATSLTQGATTVPLTILVKDSRGQAISGATVTATPGNNPLASNTALSDGNGVATFTYTPTTAGNDALTFSVLGATVSASLAVSGDDFTFITPASGSTVNVGLTANVTVQYRVGGVNQANKTVYFASTAGTLGADSVLTNGSGQATTTLTSNFAGAATVSASVQDTSAATTLPLSFVATTPTNLVLQITPTAIPPNASGSTAKQATVLARVTDVNGNPVQGQTVAFSRIADPSNGNLNPATAVTDSNGEASSKYISGPNSTSSGGVQIRATVQGYSAVVGNAQLTVNQSALFIVLGTGNTITNIDEQTYQKAWTVYVTDANGIAVPGVTLTLRILPLAYGKGALAYDVSWGAANYVGAQNSSTQLLAGEALWCANEDTNYDGVWTDGKDVDNNGSLQPGNVISLASGSSTVVTDANGRATINIQYAESFAPWVRVRLRATAIVTGTESTKDADFVVSGSSEDFSDEAIPPAGVLSPFGLNASCGP